MNENKTFAWNFYCFFLPIAFAAGFCLLTYAYICLWFVGPLFFCSAGAISEKGSGILE